MSVLGGLIFQTTEQGPLGLSFVSTLVFQACTQLPNSLPAPQSYRDSHQLRLSKRQCFGNADWKGFGLPAA